MARYTYPNLTESYAALVSTHGYFEIVEKNTFTGYRSVFSNVVDDKGNRLETPKVVYSGITSDLGIPYNGEYDDLEFPDSVTSGEEEVNYIQGKLLEYLQGKDPS